MNLPHVYLVGAYGTGDMTTSMGRFTELMRAGITARGFDVTVLKPSARLGKPGVLPRRLRTLGGLVDKLFFFRSELAQNARAARAAGRPFVFHICDQAYSNYTGVLSAVPHLLTCHDVMGIEAALGRSPYVKFGWNTRLYQKMLLRGLDRARCVACVSETTRAELLKFSKISPERVETVLIGPNHPYAPMPSKEAQTRVSHLLGDHAAFPYILHVGANIWYKNRAGAVRIFARLRELIPSENLRLVMVGRSIPPEIREIIRLENLENLILPQVNISNEDLQALYTRARAFLFPSFCEGFGWPILEAQYCACPVLTTNRAPMTEVGGDAALYFDPSDPAAAAREIAANWDRLPALSQAGPQNAKRFDTDRMLDQYAGLYRRLAVEC